MQVYFYSFFTIFKHIRYILKYVRTAKYIFNSAKRLAKQLFRTRRRKLLLVASIICAAGAYGIGSIVSDYSISPVAYHPILTVIAKGESGGNYNAYFGNAHNTKIRFTDMTIAEVLDWQDAYVKKGAASSAVGKYQIINTTLRGLVIDLKIDENQKFSSAMQDKMAIALIDKRGAKQFAKRKITAEQFAANLSMEWASLPRAQGAHAEQSYYAGDGLNKAHVAPAEILAAIQRFKANL